jgi:hypothetical protein
MNFTPRKIFILFVNEIKIELTNGLQNRSESLYLYSIKIYSIVENFLNNLMETFSKIRLKMLVLHN